MSKQLQNLLNSARHAQGGIPTYDYDGSLRHVVPTRAARAHRVSLRDLTVGDFAEGSTRIARTALPSGTEAGEQSTLDHALVAASRCVAAGARLIVVPAATEGQAINGNVVYKRQEHRFDVIEAAEFTAVPEGVDLPAAALPIYSALINPDAMSLVGVHVPLSRAAQREYQDGQLAAHSIASIAAGVAKAADAALLAAIVAANPTAFTLAKAAGAGLRFPELRALCGTAGTGSVVSGNGGLVVLPAAGAPGGIAAEFTDVIAPTVVGDFSRAAIAVDEEIQLVADRTNVNGDLELTVWVGLQALLPRPDVFWTVSA